MADHNIEINVFLKDEEVLEKLRQISAQIDKLRNTRALDIRPNVDMTGLNRFISGLQTASNLASGISSALAGFSGSIGNAFTGMSSMFSFDALNTAKRYLTVMATRALGGSLGDMISRYDILTTFTPYMQIAGVDSGTANSALQRVNESILGLPIGLDEAAYRLRRYQMFVGNTEQATNLTIGLQNALTAGGASDSMKNTAYMEMERLLTSGDLATWRQWQALITGFGVSSRFIADAMSEITGKQVTVQELARGLHEGTISVNDLLSSIEMLGQDWSTVPADMVPKFVRDMDSALDVYRGTIEAWTKNIQFAVTRGGTNMLQSLDNVMKTEYGTGITDVLSGVRDMINDVFAAGGEFIKDNPELLQTGFDIIGGLLERAKGFDWELFSTNVVTNIGRLFEMLFAAFDSLPPGTLEEFSSFAITIAGPLGSIFKAVQGGLPFMLGVFERFKDFDFTMLLEDITHQVDIFADVVERILNLVDDETMSKLLAIGLVWGAPLAKGFSALARGLAEMRMAFGLNGGIGLAGGLSKLKAEWNAIEALQAFANPDFVATYGSIGSVIGTGLGGGAVLGGIQMALTSRYNYVQSQIEQESAAELGLEGLYARLNQSALDMAGISGKEGQYEISIAEAEERAARAKELVEGIQSLHEQLTREPEGDGKTNIIRDMTQMMKELQGIYPDLSLGVDAVTGAYDANTAAIMSNIDAYMELLELQDKAAIAENVANEAQADMIRARGEQRYWKARRSDWEARYGDLEEELQALNEGQEVTIDGITYSSTALGLHKNETNLTAQEARDAAKALEDITNGEKAAADAAGIASAIYSEASEDVKEFTSAAEDMALEWPDITEATAESANAQAEALAELKQAYDELGESARETLRGQINLFAEVAEESENTYDKVRQNMLDNLKQMGEHNALLGRAYGVIENTPWSGRSTQGFASVIASLVESGEWTAVEQAVETAEKWASLGPEQQVQFMRFITGNFAYESGVEEGGQTLQDIQAYAEFGGAAAEQVGAVADAAPDAAEGTQEYASAAGEGASASEDLADGASNAADGINDAGNAASGQIGAVNALAGSMRSVATSATHAETRVHALARAIAQLQSKNITIGVSFNTGGVGGMIANRVQNAFHNLFGGGVGPAQGGYVEEAPWIVGPHGTDTIPAWLTPGEFVIKRSAAQKFGPTFLKAVNGMDIDGAFDALMHNLARPSGMYMPTVSYNRDNHATVNNYFSGETGQGYSQRKAYAWASKL